MSKALVRVDNLKKYFPITRGIVVQRHVGDIKAVDGISFDIREGETLGLEADPMELALMCNFMFVDKTAKLGQPEINLGVFAPPASLILPMKIGQARADEMLLTGKIISGEEAVQSVAPRSMMAWV